jgi:ABC-type oligopeptide transport system substrate-binding subunit
MNSWNKQKGANNMKNLKVIHLAAILLALAMVFAGCGDDKSQDSTGDGKVPDIFGNDTPSGGNDTPAGGDGTDTDGGTTGG